MLRLLSVLSAYNLETSLVTPLKLLNCRRSFNNEATFLLLKGAL